MNKIYSSTPCNFKELESYAIIKTNDIIKLIIQSPKCYFYDTCAFRNHANVLNPKYICDYIKQTSGIVIITRCILMELCSNDNKLWSKHIEYIKYMYNFGIKVLIMYEEDAFPILSACYSNTLHINNMLILAIKIAKSKTGTIESVLNNNPTLKKQIFSTNGTSDSSLAKCFFSKVRANKTSKDNLGEELIAICIHMLSNIKEFTSYKYIFLTDDKGAISLFGKTIKNVKSHIQNNCISVFTTAKLCSLMFSHNIISNATEIREIMTFDSPCNSIKIYCSEEYDLSPSEKTVTIDEFANKLTTTNGLKIYS